MKHWTPGVSAFVLLIAATGEAHAGECDCKTEIDNAKAVVTGTCSKIWSNSECTLKEKGASSAQLRGLPDNQRTLALRLLTNTLDGVVGSEFTGDAVFGLMSDFELAGENVRRCLAGAPLDAAFLYATVAEAAISFDPEGALEFPAGADLMRGALSFAQSNEVASSVCDDGLQRNESDRGLTGVFGQGCFGFGQTDRHIVVNFRAVGGCPDGIDF